MTRDTIDRAIARGVGSTDADNMEELTYEGYAPSGVAIIVEAMTDNRNRTAAEVRHAFSKCGGNLGNRRARWPTCSTARGRSASLRASTKTR